MALNSLLSRIDVLRATLQQVEQGSDLRPDDPALVELSAYFCSVSPIWNLPIASTHLSLTMLKLPSLGWQSLGSIQASIQASLPSWTLPT